LVGRVRIGRGKAGAKGCEGTVLESMCRPKTEKKFHHLLSSRPAEGAVKTSGRGVHSGCPELAWLNSEPAKTRCQNVGRLELEADFKNQESQTGAAEWRKNPERGGIPYKP